MPALSDLLFQILYIGVPGVAALIAGYVLTRRYRRQLERTTREAPFTLQDLRDLRARGEITDQEYESMRAMMIGRATHERPAAPPGSAADRPASRGDD